jgi:nucleoside-diphosphate-sugar epimerase
MVIGKGLIGQKFESYKNNEEIIIFASGVSNSKNTEIHDYEREINLLKKTIEGNSNKTLVYFSTCSVYDESENKSNYVIHKKEIEDYIKKNQKNYYIFRVSNLVGITKNKNTVLNYFFDQIKNGRHFQLWENAIRNLIDIDDMKLIVDSVIKEGILKNKIINIANPISNSAKDIVKTVEDITMLKAQFSSIEKGVNFKIDISEILPTIKKLNINFGENYLKQLVQKYYSPYDV